MHYDRIPEPAPDVFTAPLKRPPGVGEDWLEPAQRRYTEDEHAVWDELYARQMRVLPNRAIPQFFEGLERLNLGAGGVPDFAALSARLADMTGWSVVPVPMLIPDHVFFYHLANKRFPAGNFIRSRDQIDYIQEPDVFHDVFGHVPLLTDQSYADHLQAYGKGGWKALKHNRLKALGAIYWYTVEFGLMNTPEGLRIYGAGILSSAQESIYALQATSPNRLHLSIDRVMRTDYVISDLQQSYFVIDDFDELLRVTVDRPFDMIYPRLQPGFQYAPGAVLEIDRVYHYGTQEYALRGGRGSNAAAV